MANQQMTRHDFLRRSGMAAAGAVAATSLPASILPAAAAPPAAAERAAMAPMQKLRMLISPRAATGLDPLFSVYGSDLSFLWAPVLALDSALHVVPTGLATSWNVSKDGTIYTLHLRRDARFSDGSRITAHDVAWSLGYDAMLTHPAFYGVKGNYAYLADATPMIKGLQPIMAGKIPFQEFGAAPLPGVRVINDTTVQISLDRPYPLFLPALAQILTVVQPRSVMAGKGQHYGNDQYWCTAPTCAYSGPFKLTSFQSSQSYSLAPQPYFWGSKPRLSKVTATFAPDANTAVTAFQNKEADVVLNGLTPDLIRQALANKYLSQSLVTTPSWAVYQLWITPFAPMDDVHVRRAIYMAVDKQQLCTVLNAGKHLYKPLVGHFTLDNPIYTDVKKSIKPLPFDPAKARAELARSKYGDAVKTMEINIAQLDPTFATEVQVIQGMLQQNLGLTNVKIRTDKIADYSKPPFPAHLWPNGQGDYQVDPYFILHNMIGTMPTLPGQPIKSMVTVARIPSMQTLLQQVLNEVDAQKRGRLVGQIYQEWIDNAVSIDLYTSATGILVAPWVKNVRIVDGALQYMWLKPGVESIYIAKH